LFPPPLWLPLLSPASPAGSASELGVGFDFGLAVGRETPMLSST